MAQSALSKLSNMLTANASIEFSNMNISALTLMYGENIRTASTHLKFYA
ncbi:hypothetical protein [Tissierella praeacuta]